MAAKRRLLIVGAGAFGRELESWIDMIPDPKRDWTLYGYLDDTPVSPLAGFDTQYRVLARIDDFLFEPGDLALVAIADPAGKRKVVARLEGRVEFLTFVVPGAFVGKRVTLGRGTVIIKDCILTADIEVGEFVTINSGTIIGHDCRIGDYASLMGNVGMGGGCIIGESAFLGGCCTLIPKRRIGDHAVVGAGAVVFRHVPAGVSVVGNPAQVLLEEPL